MEPTIYLYFNGNCEEAMRFYAETLGGEVTGIFRNGDAPDPQMKMTGGDKLVMNMAVRLGNATMMASDAPDEHYSKPAGFSVTLAPESSDEAQRLFDTLSKDGDVRMPLGETFWAERFAMFSDRFGTPWMINYAGAKAPR